VAWQEIADYAQAKQLAEAGLLWNSNLASVQVPSGTGEFVYNGADYRKEWDGPYPCHPADDVSQVGLDNWKFYILLEE